MRLYGKMKKALALSMVAAMTVAVVPTVAQATDYTGHWAEQAITKWSNEGVLAGYEDGTFRPENTITRAELAQIITQILGLVNVDEEVAFDDVAVDAWYATSVQKVMTADIMNTYADGTFRPDQAVTREEAAYAIARAYNMGQAKGDIMFTDKAAISEWAKGEVASLVANNVLNGYPDGSLQPQGNLKRSEVVFMIDRITAAIVDEAGDFSQDIEGSLVINTADVNLKNMTITGNLYIAPGVADGDIKLHDVTVLGDVVVAGGGSNTISVFGNSKIGNIIVNKKGGEVPRVYLASAVVVENEVVLQSSAVLQGSNVKLPKVTVAGAEEVVIKGQVEVAEVVIAVKTTLELEEDVAVVSAIVQKEAVGAKLEGKGQVTGKLDIQGNDFDYSDVTMGDDVEVEEGSDVTGTVTPEDKPAGGGGGGGGGSTGPTVPEYPNVEVTSITLNAGKGNEVKIPLTGSLDVVVDISGADKVFKVEGIDLTDVTIETIQMDSAYKGDVLFSMGNLDAFAFEVTANKPYNKEQLMAIVSEGKFQAAIVELINERTDTILSDGGRTEAIRLVGEFFTGLSNAPDQVDSSYLFAKAANGEVVAERYADDFAKIQDVIEEFGLENLVNLAITSKQDDAKDIEKVVVNMTGSIDGTGDYTPKNYTVTLDYTGQ